MVDISVIVPTLNEEGNIAKTLKAIRKQKTKYDYEIIVSDSRSTDKTVQIAEKYADKVVIARGKGIWRGRNTGAKKAKGKVLVFIDADTIIPKNYLSVVYPIIYYDKSIAALSCALKFDKRTRFLKMVEDTSNYYLAMKGLTGESEVLGFNCAFRKDTFEKLGGFPKSNMEDSAMGEKARKIGRVVFLPEPKVITSARRFDGMGMLRSIFYYSTLKMADKIPDKILLKDFRKMFGYRRIER